MRKHILLCASVLAASTVFADTTVETSVFTGSRYQNNVNTTDFLPIPSGGYNCPTISISGDMEAWYDKAYIKFVGSLTPYAGLPPSSFLTGRQNTTLTIPSGTRSVAINYHTDYSVQRQGYTVTMRCERVTAGSSQSSAGTSMFQNVDGDAVKVTGNLELTNGHVATNGVEFAEQNNIIKDGSACTNDGMLSLQKIAYSVAAPTTYQNGTDVRYWHYAEIHEPALTFCSKGTNLLIGFNLTNMSTDKYAFIINKTVHQNGSETITTDDTQKAIDILGFDPFSQ